MEVADIIQSSGAAFAAQYGTSLSTAQRRVLKDVSACRTAALGGHVSQCHECGHRKVAYNSCRNRHCPKCQAAARAEWTDTRTAELLPVPYFHVVFTLPAELRPLALQNKRVVYGLLFRAAAESLQQLAADPKHLGAQIGCLAVLHTWSQNLLHHPHVHCVVPAGGLSPDNSRWIACRRSRSTRNIFFLPVKALSRLFRGKLIAYLKQAFAKEKLRFCGELRSLSDPVEFNRLLSEAVRQQWVVNAKRPFGGPQQVLKYLARYTHRVAISNQRLIDMQDGQVRFHWKDYADGGAQKIMTLDGTEFLRRFLMHTLPSGFMRIRYYGFLGNRIRREKLSLCHSLLGQNAAVDDTSDMAETPDRIGDDPGQTLERCSECRNGRMIVIETLIPHPPHRWHASWHLTRMRSPCVYDTS